MCLRVTDVLSLRNKDFDLKKGVVMLQALKGQVRTEKVMSEAVVAFVHKLQVGIKVKRLKIMGVRGKQEVTDAWIWPETPEEYLFPSSRRDSQQGRRTKDAVAKAIARARQTFQVPNIPEVQPSRIRSHSGRSRCIKDMKQHKAEREVGEKYAGITGGGVCGKHWRNKAKELNAQQVGKKLQQNRELQTYWKQMY